MQLKKIISLTITLLLFTIVSASAQSPAEYICDKLDGELSRVSGNRSFVGDAYKCNVETQWDMLIMDEVNYMVTEDDNFGTAKSWEKTFVDTENYSRRSFAFDAGKFFIVNLYVPFEKKTDYFIIAQ